MGKAELVGPKMARQRIDEIERLARISAPTSNELTLDSLEVLELVAAYRQHHRRCASCGYERCEHLRSPACEGFSES